MPSGLPARWAIKFVLFFALVILAIQASGTAARSAAILLGAEPDEGAPDEGGSLAT